ncbi:PAS domain-containing protein [Luteimonas aquatica]|uniref:PAS domain-containing protein n=1 Tax=Luteimonas aquatica TaxID=450364 RepID=UPI001F5900BB|nr:PAS domain-containing protein [Luteimonas aquatica]
MNVKANPQHIAHGVDLAAAPDFARIVEESAVGTIVVDLDGRGLYANAAFRELFGYSAEECIGLGLHDVVHPDQAIDLDAVLARLRAGGEDRYRVARKYIRKDGSALWGYGSVAVLRERRSGHPECYVVQVVDIGAKQEAEAALAAKEQYLSLAVEAGELNAWDWNPLSNQVWNYPERRTLLGYDACDVGEGLQDWTQLLHPDDRAEADEIARRIRCGEIADYEHTARWQHKDGDWRWLHTRGKVIRRAADGTPMHVAGITADVTALKQAQIDLSSANQRLKLAADAGRIGIFDVQLPSAGAPGYTLASPKVFEIFALAPLEAREAGVPGIGEDWGLFQYSDARWLAAVHPEDYARMHASWRASVTTGCPRNIEYRIRQPDGEVRHVHELATVHLDAEGRPSRYVGVLIDVSGEKRTEAELAAASERLTLATEAARIGTYDMVLPGGRTLATRKVFEIFGREAELAAVQAGGADNDWALFQDSVGLWQSTIHPDDRARMDEVWSRAATQGCPADAVYRIRRADGQIRHVHSLAQVFRNEAGEPARCIGVIVDVTDQKHNETGLALANERLQLAVAAGGIGIFEQDFATGACAWNERIYEIYGRDPGEYDGTLEAWIGYIHADDRERVAASIRAAIERTSTFSEDYRIVEGRHGAVRHVRSLARVIRDEAGAPVRAIGLQWDISDQKHLEGALYEEKERLRITLDSIGDAVVCTDPQGAITFMNPIAEALTGWGFADAIGRPVREVFITIDDSQGCALPDPVGECLRLMQPRYQQGDAVLLARDGNCIDVQSSAAPVKTTTGETIGAVLIFKDASQARALRRTLEHHANHDSLTALPNRRAFEQELREAIAEADEQGRRHAVCFLDLDRFKIVNDSAGHTAGDALLREVGDLLRYRTRSQDMVARLGGDEFALLLRDCNLAESEAIARQLTEAISTLRFRWDGRRYEVGASIGLTAVYGDILAPDDLLSQADAACYVAKARGRSHVVVYEEEPHGPAQRYRRDIKVAANIRDAIDTGRFCLYAQEIRSLQADRPMARSYEILLRMRDEKGRIVPPGEFIPAAERFGLMDRLDRWVVRNALHGEGARLRAADDITIAINLSANSLDDPTLWDFLKAELDASQLPPQRLHLEITETALIENFSSAVAFIERARAAGCGITLDDFGTGLSSFAYLRQFPVDTIKIDGSFVRQLVGNPVDRAIVESINSIARRLGARTVAEQVEDEATLQLVREIGIDQAQGYVIGRPLPLLAVL